MSFCPTCGKEIPDGSACPACSQNAPPQPPVAPPPQNMSPQVIQSPMPNPETPPIAYISLVLSILGLCSGGLLSILGAILGIVALVKINGSNGRLDGKGLAIGAIVVGVVMTLIGLFMAMTIAIAIPNFLKFQGKAMQSEAKVQLKMLQQEQMYFNVNTGRFANSFRDLEWTPPPNSHYGYCLPDEQIESSVHGYIELPPEAAPFVTDYNFVMTAVGNIDNDPFLDIWQVDMNGEFYHLYDDSIDMINIQGD
jgi:type II secretory pathway pseudopilin PulG